VNFVDNHDVPRFLAGQNDDRRRRLALAFVMCAEGVPCIYYGTEQGFHGGGDPANRERLWDSGYDTSAPLYQWISTLAGIRNAFPALRRGDTLIRWSTDRTGSEQDAGIFAFERVSGADVALFVMNVNPNQKSETAFQQWSMQTSFAEGTTLMDTLDPSFTIKVGTKGTLDVPVDSLSVRILVKK